MFGSHFINRFIFILLAAAGAVSQTARAAEIGVGIGARSEFPLATGIEGQLAVDNFRFSVTGGFILSPYATAGNSLGQSMGSYNANDAALVQDFAPGAFAFGLTVGNENFPFRGALVEFGYLFFTGQGTATLGQLASVLLNRDLAGLSTGQSLDFSGSVHSLALRVGYRLDLAPNLSLSTKVGLVKPIASSTNLALTANTPFAQTINQEVNAYMQGIFGSTFIPVVSVGLVYLFGEAGASHIHN